MVVLAYVYIGCWLIVLSSAWGPPRWTVCCRRTDTIPRRLCETLWRIPLVFALGYVLDEALRNAPHPAYTTLAFWGVFLSLCALFSVPGVVVYCARRRVA